MYAENAYLAAAVAAPVRAIAPLRPAGVDTGGSRARERFAYRWR